MFKIDLLLIACLAVFGLGGLASTTASASEWDVNGTELSGSAALANKISVLEHGVLLELEGFRVKLECSSNEIGINGAKLVAPRGLEAASISFKECSTEETGGCSIGKTISTVPIVGLVSLDGILNTLILILPKTKTTFATINFTGETCALLGIQPVKGHFHILIHKGADPRVIHRGLAFSLKGQFFEGSNEAVLKGLVVDVELESKQTWDFL